MKQVAGIYLPNGEADMPPYLLASGGTYQNTQLIRSLEFVTSWNTAIDIGAHVGLWSKVLVQKFRRVVAFEPMAPMRACLEKNVVSDRLQIVPIALGNQHGVVSLDYDETHTGATHVNTKVPGLIPIGRLDDFQLDQIGYIKLDCEGFELDALQGAVQTLERFKPIVILEEKLHGTRHYGKQPYAAVAFLESLGAELLDRVGDDLILGWPSVPGKVAAAKPSSPESQFALAQALQAKGDVTGAMIAYRALHHAHPRVPEVANLLALCELQLEQHADALEHAARACQLNMKQARYKNTLATCLWLAGRRDEALNVVRAALQDDPNLAEAQENLRTMQSERSRVEVAAATLAEALTLHPDSPQLLVRLATIHADYGSTEAATTLYKRALAIEPANTEAKLGLARVTGRAAA